MRRAPAACPKVFRGAAPAGAAPAARGPPRPPPGRPAGGFPTDLVVPFVCGPRPGPPLPPLPDALALPLASTALGVDRGGRLHAVAQAITDRSFRVVRFAGGAWDLLGQPGSLGAARFVPLFAWDPGGPYLALTDVDNIRTDVFHLVGADWQLLGGGGIVVPTAGGVPAAGR